MKTCKRCGETKPFEAFPRGLVCRACTAAYLRDYRAKNRDVLNAKKREAWANRTEDERAAERARSRERHWRDVEAQRARARDYYARNRSDVLERQCARQRAERDTATKRVREWRRGNPEKARAAKAAYYSRMKSSAPWADHDIIADIYKYAKIMREAGVNCHVDHIVPLRGRRVSGLHTHENLTVLLAEENMRKNARFE